MNSNIVCLIGPLVATSWIIGVALSIHADSPWPALPALVYTVLMLIIIRNHRNRFQ